MSSVKMDKSKLDTSRSGYREDISSHSKKNKKRSSKKNNILGLWMNNMQNNQNNDMVPGMEYQHLLWQSNVQQNFSNNGQRLFTTTSDPSMCGYTQMPMTYTMEPVSLPTMYRLYQPVPFSGIRTVHGRPRRHCNQNFPMNLSMNSMGNGYSSLQENGVESSVPINYQNGDYASLPPTGNKNNEINGDEPNSEHRRYSDPGLGSAEAPIQTQSEDSDSIDSGSSITTVGRSNKLVLSLIEQMTELKKGNSQLFKELNETKSELGSMKAKLAQCKYSSSSDYQPGMLSDFIREIRQANKTCEEGLISKVKSMMEEKLNQRSLEVANLNNRIIKLTEEKEESDRRIAKLEEEVAMLKLNANNEGREIAAFEEETLALRRELQEARASKCLAESHVAKCVNAASASQPVATFHTTQSYVTSTPVRTALSDTSSLIPPPPSSSTSSSMSLVPQHLASLLRSRNNTDLAHHHFVPDNPIVYRTADCSTTDTTNPVATSSCPLDKDQGPTIVSSIDDPSSSLIMATCLEESSNATSSSEFSSLGGGGSKVERDRVEKKKEEEEEEDGKSVEEEKNTTKGRNDEDDEALDCTKKNQETKRAKATRKEEESGRGNNSNNNNNHHQQQQHQRGGWKKSGRKKRGGLASRRWLSEADKVAERNEMGGRDARRTVSKGKEDRDGCLDGGDDDVDGDETSRAITEIPEVAVVGGGSFVPKDLCSTGILTSRVLTAPSRATYTTAYI
ncbi:uncharacterized protein LOC100865646 [Apis florea]|uniref:uncharacterized protein LOC100865646 n=1 Tax=Apis florea TaxID=7463 RepID=UPI000629A113|nr:uncharacterized protein LOC100865646 [Apis florea]XP_012345549.1 uncharacterized protein LOC100865646 [Apis florea]